MSTEDSNEAIPQMNGSRENLTSEEPEPDAISPQQVSDIAMITSPKLPELSITIETSPKLITENITEQGAEPTKQDAKTIFNHRILFTKEFFVFVFQGILAYFRRFRGTGIKNPQAIAKPVDIFWTYVAAFIGIGILSALHYLVLTPAQLSFIVAPFGASAVLIYGEVKSPLAQPRNFVFGCLISSVVGVLVRLVFVGIPVVKFLGPPLAVATACLAMQVTKTVHPPGGAIALAAVIGPDYPWYNFQFILMPVGTSVVSMLLVAVILNNVKREYPQYWW